VALTLSREVETNRQLLREAIASGSDYVRSIYGGGDAPLAYAPAASRSEPEVAGGLLLNRRA
jgi:hypothetical protein